MSKVLKITAISVASLLAIAMITVVVVLYFNNNNIESKELSIDEMNEFSYETPEVTTDLKDGVFVRIQFQLIMDSKASLKEIEKREFQIKNILIKELAVMTEEDFNAGLADLEKVLQQKLNEIMTEGTIKDVYTISKIMQ
ncbi:MAG TPA: flagellar basal body-associated FliL family protein [Candidatus Pseudogracilibacillus intestinigallinarum]|uniref:Flagellar protein FliL n=1 Tax=Candidatus Pseudogracilibacillus intestinigallinarum TaxID=2838742 RepID=A0A9D1TKS6_9BACI|nr:flagellar basal body-associated FliL family protein [Candidatus Pseudogracilibacillus intestinigallinarum]